MYRLMIAAIVIALATPLLAQDKPVPKANPVLPENVTITLSKDELNALVGLLDVAVKARGLDAVPVAARVIGKLQTALKPAAPAVPAKPEEKK